MRIRSVLVILSFIFFCPAWGQTDKDSTLVWSIRVGASYNSFEAYGSERFERFSRERWVQPSVNPVVGVSVIKSDIGKNKCCTFFKGELVLTSNKSEYFTYYPNIPFSNDTSGTATLFYTSIVGQYGWIIGEKWRIGPTVALTTRLGRIVPNSEKNALSEFGIYNIESDKFNTSNLAILDAAIGAAISYKLHPSIYLQANVNYGLIPQIKIGDLPANYQANAQLSVGYLFNSKNKEQ